MGTELNLKRHNKVEKTEMFSSDNTEWSRRAMNSNLAYACRRNYCRMSDHHGTFHRSVYRRALVAEIMHAWVVIEIKHLMNEQTKLVTVKKQSRRCSVECFRSIDDIDIPSYVFNLTQNLWNYIEKSWGRKIILIQWTIYRSWSKSHWLCHCQSSWAAHCRCQCSAFISTGTTSFKLPTNTGAYDPITHEGICIPGSLFTKVA